MNEEVFTKKQVIKLLSKFIKEEDFDSFRENLNIYTYKERKKAAFDFFEFKKMLKRLAKEKSTRTFFTKENKILSSISKEEMKEFEILYNNIYCNDRGIKEENK